MLFVTNFADPSHRAMVDTFCIATEAKARERALCFEPGGIVRFGAVKQRGRAAAFNVEGMSNGKPIELTVMIPAGMPEGDCWSLWVISFERAGLVVEPDEAYEESLFQMLDEHEGNRG